MKAKLPLIFLCLALGLSPLIAGHRFVGVTPLTDGSLFSGFMDGSLQIAAEAIIALLLAVSLGLLLFTQGVIRFPHPMIAIPVVLFWFWMILGSIESPQIGATRQEIGRWTLALFGFITFAAISGRGAALRLILLTIAIAGTLCSIRGVWEYALNGDPSWRVFGPFFNPDYFAGFLVMSIGVTLGLLSASNGSSKTLFVGMAAAQIMSLLLTGARVGLAAFVLMVPVYLLLLKWYKLPIKPTLLRLLGTFGVIIALLALFYVRFGIVPGTRSTVGITQQAHSGQFRLLTWKGALKMIAKSPVSGYGMGTFEYNYTRFSDTAYTMDAHNSYLQIAAGSGIVGLCLFLTAGVFWFLFILRRELGYQNNEPSAETEPKTDSKITESSKSKNSKSVKIAKPIVPILPISILSDDPRYYRAAVVAAIVGALIRSGVDSDLAIFANLFVFWSLVGAGVSLGLDSTVPECIPKSARIVFSGFIAFVLFIHFGSVGLANIYSSKAAYLMASNSSSVTSDALNMVEQAVKYDGLNPEFRYQLGEMLYYQSAKSGNFTASAEQFQKAALVQPCAKSFARYASILEKQAEVSATPIETERLNQSAIDALNSAVGYNPHDPQLQLRLAGLYQRINNQELAVKTLENIVELRNKPAAKVLATPEFVETGYAEADMNLARIFNGQQKPELAKSHYESAIKDFEQYRLVTRPMIKKYTLYGLDGIAGFTVSRDEQIMNDYITAVGWLKNYYLMRGQSAEASQYQELENMLLTQRDIRSE